MTKTLEELWNDVKSEVASRNWLSVYRIAAVKNGYSLNDANLYLNTIFPKDKCGLCDTGDRVPDKSRSREEDYQILPVPDINALMQYLSGTKPEENL